MQISGLLSIILYDMTLSIAWKAWLGGLSENEVQTPNKFNNYGITRVCKSMFLLKKMLFLFFYSFKKIKIKTVHNGPKTF
jgi:hypothetical protein